MLNVVALLGRLTDSPKSYDVKEGEVTRISFSLAVNTGKEETSFFDCIAFGKVADTFQAYVKKGHRVVIHGSLRQRKWTDEDGDTHAKVEIIVAGLNLVEPLEKAPEVKDEELPFNKPDELPAGWHWEDGKPVKDTEEAKPTGKAKK